LGDMVRDLKEVLGTKHGATAAIRLTLRTGLLEQFKAMAQARREERRREERSVGEARGRSRGEGNGEEVPRVPQRGYFLK